MFLFYQVENLDLISRSNRIYNNNDNDAEGIFTVFGITSVSFPLNAKVFLI